MRGVEGDATQMSKSLSEMLASYLNGPSLKSIALEARLADQAVEEAKQTSCGNVLLTSFEHKRGGSGAFSKAAAAAVQGAAWNLPYSGVAAAGAHAGAVAGAYAVSSFSQNTQAKDELIVEYPNRHTGDGAESDAEEGKPEGEVERRGSRDAARREGRRGSRGNRQEVARAFSLHTGAVDMAAPEYTTDADVAIDLKLLDAAPGPDP